MTASPGDERLATSGDDLAGVDARAGLEAQSPDCLAHLGGRLHRPKRVVLVGLRDPEHRHRRVAHELLDRAPVALEDRAELRVVAAHQLPQQLWVCAVTERGRADEVAEQDGDGLADAGRALGGERRGTGVAEARAVGILLTALGADLHRPKPMACGWAIASPRENRKKVASDRIEPRGPYLPEVAGDQPSVIVTHEHRDLEFAGSE